MFNNEAVLVLSAAVLNFCLGGVWYSLFCKKWMLACNLKMSDIDPKDPKPYLIAFIGSLWASYGMFILIKHIHPNSVIELLSTAIGAWLFLLVGMGAKHYAFAKKSLTAFLIDYILDLVGLILISFIVWGAI